MPRRNQYPHIYQLRLTAEQWENIEAEIAERKEKEPWLTHAHIIRERIDECEWSDDRKEQRSA